jgi:hypothetical protein
MVDVHTHVAGFLSGDQRRVNPRDGRQFVPHLGTALVCHRELHYVLRGSAVALLDFGNYFVSDSGFDGGVNRRADDLLPRRL